MPSKSELRRQWNAAGHDVVVLHQLPRARTSPSLSPFPLKFETFLRMAKIEYVNDFTTPMSPKGTQRQHPPQRTFVAEVESA
jgi:hypothetical protein